MKRLLGVVVVFSLITCGAFAVEEEVTSANIVGYSKVTVPGSGG